MTKNTTRTKDNTMPPEIRLRGHPVYGWRALLFKPMEEQTWHMTDYHATPEAALAAARKLF
jgi:hypothetical protein